MGLNPLPGNHHRRRSSALTGTGASQFNPIEQRDDNHRQNGDGNSSKRDEQRPLTEDTEVSDLSSIAESVEMDYMSSDDDHDDEETGLTTKQRRQRRRRRKQRRHLDARIAGVKASRLDTFTMGLTDKDIIKKLLVNACLILLWYFFSLSISIVSPSLRENARMTLLSNGQRVLQYNKWMFSEDAVVFPFPLFTSSLHMAVQFILSASLLYLIPSLRPRNPSAPNSPNGDSNSPTPETRPVLTKFFYLTRLVPCGSATSLDIGLGNMSLRFISLTFLTMCKSSALAFVLLFAFLFRLENPSIKLILIIVTMTIGVVMMVAGETAFNAVGFALVIASAFFSGFRWGLTQILLLRHPATSNPFSTLFFLTPVMFISLIIIALGIEGPIEIAEGFKSFANAHGTTFGIVLLIFPGILAFCMISSEFALLKRSSVVTLSICGIFKEVITISAAGVVFHDRLTVVNVVGLIITISSIATYNYMKISTMRREARKDTLADSDDADSDTEDSGISNHGRRGDYHRVANQEISTPNHSQSLRHDNNISITPPNDDLSANGRAFRVRASGASSSVHGLRISTSGVSNQAGPFSPRGPSGLSPMKSAPPGGSLYAEAERALGPGNQANSSVSPTKSSPGAGH
ncbi:nucleotide-sugar transporter [Aspergillus sclerotialis]|uniref:Nucleotide-sugar transporter n=1 Tax=Aspergillus sclerotialis TaxID=2070753 RepID=A0A3A2ZAZ7_9EURO|nr:nucleotide-sugar transporter [Aspergillus sclerotialis]